MGKITSLLIGALIPLVVAAQTKLPNSSPFLAFTHVTVLDMAGGPAKPDMTVIVTGNRITSVQNSNKTKVPSGAQVVDATGKFLLPGLWDMHVHTLRQQGINNDNFFSIFLANGVTGVRDTGNSPLSMIDIRHLRAEVEQGIHPGPRLYVAGPLVDGAPSQWKSTVIATTPQKGVALVDSLKTAGVDFIKVYNKLNRETYFAIANEAKRQEIPFAGHIPESVTAVEASAAGQKSIEHLSEILLACSSREEQVRKERSDTTIKPNTPESWLRWRTHNRLMLDTYDESKAKALFTLLIKNTTWQCPTLVHLRSLGAMEQLSQVPDDRLKYLHASVKQIWSAGVDFEKKTFKPADLKLLQERYQKQLQLVGAMKQAGVPLLAGTDVTNPYVYPGFSLHEELGLLVEAGLSPLEALQAATLNPAKYLGQTASLGTVEPGKLADLLLLDANPLENISHTKKIAAVVADGHYYSKQKLNQMLSAAEAASQK